MKDDHDILIEVNTKVERLIIDLKELKDNLAVRVSNLEEDKISMADIEDLKNAADILHQDHERRIRMLEKVCYIGMGALGILQIILRFYKP